MSALIWPTDTSEAPIASSAPVGAGYRLRAWTGAIAMVLLFVVIFIASAIDPVPDDGSAKVQLADAKANQAALQTTIMLEFVLALLAVATVFSIVGAVRRRGVTLANVAGVIGTLGIVGLVLIPVGHILLLGLAQTGESADVVDAFHTAAPPFTAVFLFATPVALVLLAAAAWRARIIGWLPFAIVALYFVLDLIGVLPGGELIPSVIGLVGFAFIAVGLVRRLGVTTSASASVAR